MNKKVDKRTDIINAARDLFHTKGYNDMTIDDIVKKAGVGKGTFYRYFKNKTELLILKMEKVQDRLKKILSECIEPEISLEDNLGKILDCFLTYNRKHIKFFRILDEQTIRHPEIIGKAIKNRIKDTQKHFKCYIEENIKNGNLIDSDSELILNSLSIFFHGAKEVEAKTGVIMGKTKQKKLVELLLNGIKRQ